MFCPKCKVEYREGFLQCSDCHIDLVNTLPTVSEPLNWLCPKCNTRYPDGSRACSDCHVDLEAGVCSKCKTEYRQGVKQCSDCHIDLVRNLQEEKCVPEQPCEKNEAEGVMGKNFFSEFMRNSSLKYSPKETLKWLFTDPSMRKRIAITFGLLVVAKVISFIPLPGIDVSAFHAFLNNMGHMQSDPSLNKTLFYSFGFVSLGKDLSRVSILGLGLMPFLSSCIFLQVGSCVIPKLKKYAAGGEGGRESMKRLTYIFTIVLSAVQAYFISLWLENPQSFHDMVIVANPGLVFRCLTVLTMTASVVLLLFVVEMINRRGIGNGVALIIVSSYLLKFPEAIFRIVYLVQNDRIPAFYFVVLAAIFAVLAYVFFHITNKPKTVEVFDGGQNKAVLYLRNTLVGKEPIALAAAVMLFPATIASLTRDMNLQHFYLAFTRNYVLKSSLDIVFVILLTLFYAVIVFDPKYLNGLIGKYGFAPVMGNDEKSEDFWDGKISKVLIMTALVLVITSVIPSLISHFLKMPSMVAGLFGGSFVLLLVGVFSDILSQAEFFKAKSDSHVKDWTICYTALDEFDATIKASFLKAQNIPALVEPLRFSWGMPIRTIVDSYKIYVPQDKTEEARKMII